MAVLLYAAGAAIVMAGPGRENLPGHVPAVVAWLSPLGLVPATNEMRLTIGLRLRNEAALDQFLQQLYDPASVNYHHYLTLGRFTEQFGPTEQDYDSLVHFAESNGLSVVATYPNRAALGVTGSVGAIENVFHTALHTYRHPTENRTFYSPDTEPSIDLNVPISHVNGLDDYFVARPANHIKARVELGALASVAPAGTGSGPSGLYLGGDFRAAYVPGVNLNGAGQNVALFELDGYYASDISSYLSLAKMPPVPLTNILVNSFNGSPGANNVEVALDIDMAIVMAPNLSTVMVYEAPNNSSGVQALLNRIASDNLASQISSSWLIGDNPSYVTAYKQMAAQGQSFFQASGDDGAYYSAISQWGDDTNVTLVGGTTLTTTGPGGAWLSESAWNWYITNPPYTNATGGGVSINGVPIPSWQQGINMAANQGSTTLRNSPDVALTADNIFIYADNGTGYSIGGTSAAAPLWAGFTALINQQAVSAGQTNVGFLNPALYAIGKGNNYTGDFHDIITGNNTNQNMVNNYFAVPGYDLCTGWGTPNGANLINALAPLKTPFFLTQPSGQNATNGAYVAFGASAGGASPLVYQWQFNGAMLADGGNITGSASNILSLTSVSAANAGSYNLIVTNIYGAATSSVAVLNIGIAPAIAAQPISQTVLTGGNVVFSATATGSPSLTYQWFGNGTPLSNGAGISGASSNVLTLASVTISSAGNYAMSATNAFGAATSSNATLTVMVPPIIAAAGWALRSESATPANGAIDPGETVTVSFNLQNQGTISTTNLVATLLPSSSVLAPSAAQAYGVVPGNNGAASEPFAFTAAGTCGSNVVASLQLQDGTNNLGTVVFNLPLGQLINGQTFAQNFDGVTAPALPSGWSTTNITGIANNWAAATAVYDTPPNSAFVADIAGASENALVSPAIPIVSPNARLYFRHNFSFDIRTFGGNPSYRDGGVLQIQIGNGGFNDMITAGGSFVAGGYSGSISTSQNPLGKIPAWIGSSSGWQAVLVNLPPSAAGQNIQLRWNLGTDNNNTSGAVGWYMDSVSITDSVPDCLPVFADLGVGQSLSPGSFQPGQNLIYTLSVTNFGPQPAVDVILTDSVPVNAMFVSASPGCAYSSGQVICPAGMLALNASTNFTVTVTPAAGSAFTNTVVAGTVTPEINPGNNSSALISTQTAASPPAIAWSFTNLVLAAGTNAGVNMPDVTGTNYILITDASGPVTIAQNPTNNAFLPLGTNTVLLAVSGSSANTAYSTNTITVVVSTNSAPQISGIFLQGARSIILQMSGGYGCTYVLEATPDLTSGDWLPVATNTVGINGAWQFADAVTNTPVRFYRLLWMP